MYISTKFIEIWYCHVIFSLQTVILCQNAMHCHDFQQRWNLQEFHLICQNQLQTCIFQPNLIKSNTIALYLHYNRQFCLIVGNSYASDADPFWWQNFLVYYMRLVCWNPFGCWESLNFLCILLLPTFLFSRSIIGISQYFHPPWRHATDESMRSKTSLRCRDAQLSDLVNQTQSDMGTIVPGCDQRSLEHMWTRLKHLTNFLSSKWELLVCASSCNNTVVCTVLIVSLVMSSLEYNYSNPQKRITPMGCHLMKQY